MRLRHAILSTGLLLSASASAQDFVKPTFTLGGEIGMEARYIDAPADARPSAFGLDVGLRSELNVLMHFKFDAHYTEGRIFEANQERLLDISASLRTPRLFFVALDMHEAYVRFSERPRDPLSYVLPGIAFLGDLVGTLKATVGYAWIQGVNPVGPNLPPGHGGFVGMEYMLRSKVVDFNLRGAGVLVYDRGSPQVGLLADTDLFIKAPVGRGVFLGPRFDVAYRNLQLLSGQRPLFDLHQEVQGRLSFAVQWGTGVARTERGVGRRGGAAE